MYDNQTQGRQFLDEVKFMNLYNKDYDFLLGDNIKAGLSFGDMDKFLEEKRLTYNNTIVELVKKYQIETDDVYSDLDKIWNEQGGERGWLQSMLKALLAGGTVKILGFSISTILAAPMLLASTLFLLPIPAALAIETRNTIANKWTEYKQAVYQKMEDYVSGMKNGKQ